MAILRGALVNEHSDQFEDVFSARFRGVAEVIDLERADINEGGEIKMIIDLCPPEFD